MSGRHEQSRLKVFALFTLAMLFTALLWLQSPLFALVALVAIPVLLAVLVCRLDIRYAAGSLLLVVIILSLLTGKLELALMLVYQTGPLGLFMGLLFKNGVSWGKALSAVLVLSLFIPVGVYLTEYFATGSSPFVLDEGMLSEYRQGVQELKEAFFAGKGQVLPDGEEFDRISRKFEAAMPILSMSSTLIWSMLLSAVSFFAARRLIKRMGYNVAGSIPFIMWKLPWYSIWGVIAGLAMMLGGEQLNSLGTASAGKVLLCVMGFVYAVLGLSVFTFFLRVMKLSRVLKFLSLLIFIFFLPNVLAVLTVIGIIDSIWNIRWLTQGRKPEEDDLT